MSDEVFRLALPGFDVKRGKIEQMVADNRYPNPKIDVEADPPHAGIIFLNWNDTSIINFDVTKVLHSFKHKYNQIPSVFASYKFDDGANILRGTLPFQLGALGMITMDADESNIALKYYSLDFLGTNLPVFTMQVRFYVMAEAGM